MHIFSHLATIVCCHIVVYDGGKAAGAVFRDTAMCNTLDTRDFSILLYVVVDVCSFQANQILHVVSTTIVTIIKLL